MWRNWFLFRPLFTDIIWSGPEINQDPASDICQRVSNIDRDWKKLLLAPGRFKVGWIVLVMQILTIHIVFRAFICKCRDQRALLRYFILSFADFASGSAGLTTHLINPHSSENVLKNLNSIQHCISYQRCFSELTFSLKKVASRHITSWPLLITSSNMLKNIL